MYKKYVKEDHPDNKNAYFNWSLCAFKLDDYQECIRTCREALALDPTYAKVYYRLVQAYQKLEDNYGVMWSAGQFCRIYADDHSGPEYK